MDFSSFPHVIFRCKWWNTFYRNNVKEDHDSGLLCIHFRKMWHEAREPYVFPKHWSRVFFYPYVLDRDCWFVLRHNPTSKHIFKNNNFIMPSEEDNQGNGNGEWYVLVLFIIYTIVVCFCFLYFTNYIVFLFVLLEFYNIIGEIHKCFYTFFCSGNIFTLKTKYFKLCTISMIIRVQGHNPSQKEKWEENSEFGNNIEDLVLI